MADPAGIRHARGVERRLGIIGRADSVSSVAAGTDSCLEQPGIPESLAVHAGPVIGQFVFVTTAAEIRLIGRCLNLAKTVLNGMCLAQFSRRRIATMAVLALQPLLPMDIPVQSFGGDQQM